MISTFVALIPTMIAAAAVPGWMALMLMLLQRRSSLQAASWFLGGILGSRLLQGLAVGWVTASLTSLASDSQATRAVSSLIEIIIGLAMLGTAIRALTKSPDADAPPSQWLSRLRTVPAPLASLAGVFLMLVGTRQWIFAFGAIRTIQDGNHGRFENVLLYVLFTIGAACTLILPFAVRALGGEAARRQLDRGNDWLERHGHTLLAIVSLALGIYFLIQGLGDIF